MRYSKSKRILALIISITSFIFVAILIVKGVNYAKHANGAENKSLIKANINGSGIFAKATEKVKETLTGKDESKTDDTQKVEIKSTKAKIVKPTKVAEEPIKNPADKSMEGKYKLSQLIIEGKDYSEKELEKLREAGNSLSLELKDNGVAIISVLDVNGIYEYDNDYFYDGLRKIQYSKNTDRVRVIIGNKNMLFIKE